MHPVQDFPSQSLRARYRDLHSHDGRSRIRDLLTDDDKVNPAKDLVRMAVAKASLLEPLEQVALFVNKTGLVVGGGVAGMEAARMG